MTLKVFLSGTGYTKHHFQSLSEHGFEITHEPGFISQNDLIRNLSQYHAYVLGGDERLTDIELQHAKHLKLISFVGTGYTSFIDESAAQKYRIAIKNTPAVMAPAVAEHTIGLILGLQRRLFAQNWRAKQGTSIPYEVNELSSLCVGIVGLGEIGARVARILRSGFGSQVIYTSRTRKPQLEAELALTFVTMETLFSSADIIVLALPTHPETEFFVNDTLLTKVQKGAMLVNTAGAKLVEPNALRKHLVSQQLGAAAFDGYYIEPLPHPSEDPYHLLSLTDEQFIVTPHTAAKTNQSWHRMLDMSINNVLGYFSEAACV